VALRASIRETPVVPLINERAGKKKEEMSGISLREALFGDPKERPSVTQRSAGRDVQYGAALASAFAGDDKRAQLLTNDLGEKFPEDTIVQLNYLPTL
jgi:hypothetical protein